MIEINIPLKKNGDEMYLMKCRKRVVLLKKQGEKEINRKIKERREGERERREVKRCL